MIKMDNLTKKQLIFIKKCIGAGCAFLCLVLMLFAGFKYVSSSQITSGDSITWDDSFSIYSMLFNGDKVVLDSQIKYLRELFDFSYVIMWISFVLMVISFGILIYGIFSKKNLVSKIGSIVLVASFAILILVSFDDFKIGRTVRYLSIFNPAYLICLSLSFVGLFSTLTIKDK